MGFIEFKNVEKQYKNATKKSVTDFNLSIDEKEFIVFVGPSGCGKSTTLRMLAGFEEITGGTISIDGNIVNNTPPRERGISMVFQNYALYPHMTVEDNIALFPLTSILRKFICGEPMKLPTNLFLGLSYKSIGVPICCIIPSFITTILSAIVIAST